MAIVVLFRKIVRHQPLCEALCEAVTAVSEREGILHNEVTAVDELIDGADGALVRALQEA